jgi:hypothetical protein
MGLDIGVLAASRDGEKFTGPRRFRRTFHPVLHYDDSFNGVAL